MENVQSVNVRSQNFNDLHTLITVIARERFAGFCVNTATGYWATRKIVLTF